MYAQAVCLPSGARDGSCSDCWPQSMNGRSGSPPIPAVACSTSSSAPPTWTVPAAAASGALHGIGPESAQSTFSVGMPWRKRRSAAA